MSRPTPYKGPKVGQEPYDAATGRFSGLRKRSRTGFQSVCVGR